MFILTEAAASVVGQHESGLTDALEAARGVFARAELTDVGLHVALVDICAGQNGGRGGSQVCKYEGVNAELW